MITPCKVHPSEAQLATLPHYLHPGLPMETSEVRAQFRNPFQVIKGTTHDISSDPPMHKTLSDTKCERYHDFFYLKKF